MHCLEMDLTPGEHFVFTWIYLQSGAYEFICGFQIGSSVIQSAGEDL